MNLPKNKLFFEHTWKIKSLYMLIPVLLLLLGLAGCVDNVHLPTTQELIEFENASPLPSIDMDRIVKAKIGGGPYHVIVGDAIELTMPAVVRFITTKEMGSTTTVTPYITRVNTNGNITLPIVGDIEAAGRTLPQIESDIIDAYYPKHVITRPSVYARVLEYHTFKVSITGAVTTPGIYSLHSDQMSLVALIMEAGGIIDEGAALIRIVHDEEAVSNEEDTVIKTAERTFYQPGGQSITSPVESTADQIITNQNDIPPFFRHAYSSSAIGALATRQGDKRLLTCYGGTADNSQKPILVDRLTLNKPQVSKTNIDEELFSPAKPVEYRYSESNLINTAAVANSNLESNTHDLSLKTKSDGAYGQDFIQTSTSNSNFRSQRITETSGSLKSKSIVLPVKGYNIPFTDVALQEGDSVIVERLEPPLFTVIDLVNSPGNFPYPPDVQYTLMQAIGFAGGLNLVTEPRYATIYRLKRDGTCISATFPIKGKSKLADASNTLIKPGDIIAIEHTPRTRTALFFDRMFRISIGSYWRINNDEL